MNRAKRGKLEGAAAASLPGDRLGHRPGRMPAEGTRDAQHHVQVAVPIDIREVGALALFHKNRRVVIVRPKPGVRDTRGHPGPPPGEKLSRTRPLRHETLILCRLQGPHPVQIKKGSVTPCHTRPTFRRYTRARGVGWLESGRGADSVPRKTAGLAGSGSGRGRSGVRCDHLPPPSAARDYPRCRHRRWDTQMTSPPGVRFDRRAKTGAPPFMVVRPQIRDQGPWAVPCG